MLSRFILFILAAALFLPGLNWGLPSRSADPYLFGDRTPWTGQQILSLVNDRSSPSSLGADVDREPITDRAHPKLLNATDQDRAAIILRYRLYSYQPDEMITLMSLASMHPARLDLDPKLYQYGGLWIYPVGTLLKLSSALHIIHLTPDLTYYLDHPESFARFYIIARLYVVLFAFLGLWTIHTLARQLSSNPLVPFVASLCYIFMPVIINMSHEAKPHLPGAVLILLTILAATRYIQLGTPRTFLLTAILAGVAVSMVLTSLPVLLILPLMTLFRPQPWTRRLTLSLASILIAAAVYALTNPYVPINLLTNRALLASNFQNSAAMYHAAPSLQSLTNTLSLLAEGTGLLPALAGLLGLLFLRPKGKTWVILGVLSVINVSYMVVFGGQKGGEFGRFAILPDLTLSLAAILFFATFPYRIFLALLVLFTALPGLNYLASFLSDTTPHTTRLRAAEVLRTLPGPIAVPADPAPYSMPPLDLFTRPLFLLPKNPPQNPSYTLIRPLETLSTTLDSILIQRNHFCPPTPISWAAKPFEIVLKSPSP